MTWTEVVRPQSRTTLRHFAASWLVVFGAWAMAIGVSRGWPTLSVLLGITAVGIGVPGLFAPALIRRVYFVAMVVTFPIGWVVSRFVMLVIYYGVFTPLGILFRLKGRDALRLRPQTRESSMWVRRESPTDPVRYFRQF